ncbi:METAL TOLERANCE PROTEIN 9 [Salix koriyanagi]|uniref:METAL TOLERANCE PROTEIN 9 n=1 Tax=Salix koriyanagi TaxID=2511006 RepID=A0A9Q0WS08_9ROSI|nr:METAL TOLERANCE PROTEIN 9 [Salix koriyanagi]
MLLASGKQRKVSEYYKKQERLLEGYNEMEAMTESGCFPGKQTEDELKQLAKSERLAVNISNGANLLLFTAKVYASIGSKSLAVIASTLDSLLDLLSGFILWFTSYAMKKPNHYQQYPIGKKRMQPVGIIVFASIMATLGLQILLESGRQLIAKRGPEMNKGAGEMDDYHYGFFGLATAVLAVRYYWWIDPTGAIIIALYTINTWTRTVFKNVWSLIGRTAPPEFLAKLTYLIWNHHKEIKQIDTVRAYSFGNYYFVEVDIVLPGDMVLNRAYNIGEDLQEKLEQLPEVERAFVHIDFEFSHRPKHRSKV